MRGPGRCSRLERRLRSVLSGVRGILFGSHSGSGMRRGGSRQLRYVAGAWDIGYVSVAGGAQVGNPNRRGR